MRPIIRQPLQFGVPETPAAASSDRSSEDVPLADNQNPYAAPQTIEHSLPSESFLPVIGLAFGLCVWLLFALSLILPGASPVDGWGSNGKRGLPGYLCALIFWPCWLSNLLMATFPIWLIATAIWRFPRCAHQLILWLLILSGIGALGLSGILFKDVGYWLWVLSFFLAALAWLMISYRSVVQPPTYELTSHLRNN